MKEYEEKEFEKLIVSCSNMDLLIVTTTDIETLSLHTTLTPLKTYSSLLRVYHGSQTYFVGQFGAYNAIHVQCGMGSVSRDSSLSTVSEAIKTWKPKVTLMLGIAFGIDETKQKIGDVLVSEGIIPYDFKKVSEKETYQRSLSAPANKILVNRFKNLRTWEYLLPSDDKSKQFVGPLLSGEELIDKKGHRDKLKEENPTSIGGEMEGAGLYAACDDNCAWIIVKGICDFADGKKDTNKDSNQEIAASVAVSICLEVFSSKTAFNTLGLEPVEVEMNSSNPELISGKEASAILFDIYDITKEHYYIERTIDKTVINCLNHYSIWLSGPTGCGKSNLIYRNLLRSNYKTVQISLASCIGLDIDDFFEEIIEELSHHVEPTSHPSCHTFPERVRQIIQLIEKKCHGEECFIFIDEIPLSDTAQFKTFTEKIVSLFISISLNIGLSGIRFVLSSINSPQDYITSFQQKIHQQMKFLPLDYWEIGEAEALVKLISTNINYQLDEDIFHELILKAKGSPRFIKKFFRNLLAVAQFDKKSLLMIIAETERELRSI